MPLINVRHKSALACSEHAKDGFATSARRKKQCAFLAETRKNVRLPFGVQTNVWFCKYRFGALLEENSAAALLHCSRAKSAATRADAWDRNAPAPSPPLASKAVAGCALSPSPALPDRNRARVIFHGSFRVRMHCFFAH